MTAPVSRRGARLVALVSRGLMPWLPVGFLSKLGGRTRLRVRAGLVALSGVPVLAPVAVAQQERPGIVVEAGAGFGALFPLEGDVERHRVFATTLVGQVTFPAGAFRVGLEYARTFDRGEVFLQPGLFESAAAPSVTSTTMGRQFMSLIAVLDAWSVIALKAGTGVSRLEYVTPCQCEDASGQYKTLRSATVTTLGISTSPRQAGSWHVAPAIDWLLPSGRSGRVTVVSLRLQHATRRERTSDTR